MTISETVRKFAASRETSVEIAQAIFECSSERPAAVIWDDPTVAEFAEVTRLAFEISEEDALNWGDEIVRRPAA